MPEGAGPLLAFGVYPAPVPADAVLAQAAVEAPAAAVAALEPMISRGAYGAAMDQVMAYIAAGDCYQINLTFPLATRLLTRSAPGRYGGRRGRRGGGGGGFFGPGG